MTCRMMNLLECSSLLIRLKELRKDLAALGFLGLGPQYYDRGRLEVAEEWEDSVDVVNGFMALTVACARCHDHKLISAADYHAFEVSC